MPDSTGVFPWHDEIYLESARPNPLAVAARALMLSHWLIQTAKEHDVENAWILYGLGEAAGSLARAGDFDALGILLTGLESLVPPFDRARWPLSQVIADQYTDDEPAVVTAGRRNGC